MKDYKTTGRIKRLIQNSRYKNQHKGVSNKSASGEVAQTVYTNKKITTERKVKSSNY